MKGYTLSLSAKTLTITKAFEDAVSKGEGEAYALYTKFMREIPGLTVVRKWFVAQFPEFRKNPLFYLYNEVKVVNIAPYIQEAQERAEELEAKKAEEQTA